MIDGAHVEGVGALDHLHANTVLHLPALPAGVPAVQPQVDELVKGHDNRAMSIQMEKLQVGNGENCGNCVNHGKKIRKKCTYTLAITKGGLWLF